MMSSTEFLRMANSITNGIRQIINWLVIVFFGFMILSVTVQVFARYVFAFSVDWLSEVAIFSQIWMILLAAGLAMRENLHVSVDALVNMIPVAALRLLITFISVLCLWFIWHAIAGSIDLIRAGSFQTSPVMKIPMSIAYLCLPLGLTYFSFELVLSLLARWKDPKATVSDSRKIA